ncbi:hypothetical protein FOMPIDRAFT_91052 [Fomitopsis schrenkii]|uniref:Uncharacterized protein n=1 Tax=Fomitopsis schrenkii TaxID=2126942 RepID=S8E4I8_FOMSC|nr:hypothetical protein FOMPIDRAFT_91052 [Fomitopsis schrenkii]
MPRQVPQHNQPHVGGEDFREALAGVSSDADETGDEDADPPAVPRSLLVPPEPSQVRIPGPGSSAKQYQFAMMAYQVENGTLRELITNLFAENYSLRERLNSPAVRTAMQSGSGSAARNPPGWTREWHEFARQYLFFIAPWPSQAAFGVAARPSVDPNSQARYTNEDTKRAAEAAELYDLIPRKFHAILSRTDSGFVTTFRRKVQGARSNLLATLITHAGQIFGDMPSGIFNRNASSSRETNPDIQRLLRDSDGKYGPFARVLFPIEEDNIDMKHIFLSMYLVRILSLMLFGPQSLGLRASNTTMGQAPVGKRWNVTKLTPGLLAVACLFLIYILSADPALQHNKPGDKTSIDYATLFETLKRIYIFLSPERKRRVDDFFALHLFHLAPSRQPSEAAGPSFSIEDGLLAINEPSILLEDGLDVLGDVPSDNEPHHDVLGDVPNDNEPRHDEHVGSVSAPVASGILDSMRAPLPTSTRSTSASSRAISPISSLSYESAVALDSEVVPIPSPSPVVVPAPRNTAASGSSKKGKERATTTADALSSAIGDLAIEAYVPRPVTITAEAAPGASAEARGSRRGRSAAKGKVATVVLTPVVAPAVGDNPQVPVAPPSKRKRRQG